MTIIDARKIKTIADLKAALSEFPDDSEFEVIFKEEGGGTIAGSIDAFAAVHGSTRPGRGAVVELVVSETAS